MNSNRLIACVVAVILLAAVVFAPVPNRGEWLRVLQDFGHALAFGGIALAALLAVRTSKWGATIPTVMRYLMAFVIAVALGGLTELAQFVVKRDPSWVDLRSDAIGAAAFLGFAAACDPRVRRVAKVVCALAAVALLVAHSLPTVAMFRAYEKRDAVFPVLAGFAERRDLYFLQPQWAHMQIAPLPSAFASAGGEKALHVTLLEGEWPGVDFHEPVPDWRGSRALAMDIVNPTGQPLQLAIRAHDASHNNEFADRFNRQFEVPPRTRSTIRMRMTDIESAPRGRQMDLQRMMDFLIFREPGATATEFYLVSVRLEQ